MFNTRFTFTADDLSAFSRDGFLISRRVLDDAHVDRLRARFDALFHGEFETGACPDEVNWREDGHRSAGLDAFVDADDNV